VRPQIRALLARPPHPKLVVLDDDPTGTQTVHHVPVLTVWDEATLAAEFAQPEPCFFLLTNSRSLPADAARALTREIARNLRCAATFAAPGHSNEPRPRPTELPLTVVSRSDSTLRGHFPLETDVLSEELGPFDVTFVIPYFEAGGRYTVGDVHYVAEGGRLVPAAETAFARDVAFGYRSSNLRDWVEEKTAGRIRAADVQSIPLEALRPGASVQDPIRSLAARLRGLPRGSVCVVNAAHPRDMEFFALAALAAEHAGARFLYRTAAQFVAARLALEPAAYEPQPDRASSAGGLIVVGSYVPRSTEQLHTLLATTAVDRVPLDVKDLLDPGRREQAIGAALALVTTALRAGRDVVVFTSRQLITDPTPARSLQIGRQVSEALVALVQRLHVRPRYLVAKGGITSSDLATRGLGVRRATVLGQILPGVPVWELGPETKYPGMPYVVFPGNVGGTNALTACVERFKPKSP